MERHPLHYEASWVDPPDRGKPGSGSELVLVAGDREWIDRIRGGEGGALQSLHRQHARALAAFAHRYVQSVVAAQEVVQEVFARLWQGRHSWAFHGTVRGYLFASAHRLSVEALRRAHREARWHAGLPPDESLIVRDDIRSIGERVSAAELEASVAVAIARLPARARIVAFMRWGDRLSREEIATVLGLNARTVHSQLTPAAEAMRKRLGSPDDIVDAWSTAASTREASDAVDPFAGIDPDRLEEYLACECLPSDETALQDDVFAAGGEPAALDAMRMAWLRPGRAVEALADEEGMWRTLARRIGLPVDAGVVELQGRRRLLERGKAIWSAMRSATSGLTGAVSRVVRQIGAWGAGVGHDGTRAAARGGLWIGQGVSQRVSLWRWSRYAGAAGETELGRFPHLPAEEELWSEPTPRGRRVVVALLIVALAAVASVWVYAARGPGGLSGRGGPTTTTAPVGPRSGTAVEGGTVVPPGRLRGQAMGRRHRRVAPPVAPGRVHPRAGAAAPR